jgi:hypothetical protein
MNSTPSIAITVPKPKRCWCQFSLRGLFVLVVVICVPLPWLGAKRREAAVARALIDLDCACFPDWQWENRAEPLASKVFGSSYFRKLFGRGYFFTSIVVVVTCSDKLADADIARLEGLPRLHSLRLSDRDLVSDAGMERIGRLSRLRNLDLIFQSRVTDAGMKYLQGLRNLRCLRIYGRQCQLTDAGLSHLKELNSLELLVLDSRLKITEAAIADFQAALPSCQVLYGNDAMERSHWR